MASPVRLGTSLSSRIATVIASYFYVGFIPVIPGTFGSLAAFSLYFALHSLNQWRLYVLGVTLISIIGVWAANKVEKDSKIVDPSFVVIDEVAGQLITFFLIPLSWVYLPIGFLLFRAFDILKPFPARRAEELPGGWGIMVDDIIAGIYANLFLQLTVFVVEKYLHYGAQASGLH
jgi:phosphatidylglycerophosphatase A